MHKHSLAKGIGLGLIAGCAITAAAALPMHSRRNKFMRSAPIKALKAIGNML